MVLSKSTFYSSNEKKQNLYNKQRRVEENNADLHQIKLYEQLAKDRGDIEQADQIANLAVNVVKKIGQVQIPNPEYDKNEKDDLTLNENNNNNNNNNNISIKGYLFKLIKDGKLSEWWDKIKQINPKLLSKKAQIVQKDIESNVILKEKLNDLLGPLMYKKNRELLTDELTMDKLLSELVNLISGGDETIIRELNINLYPTNQQEHSKPSKRQKRQARERRKKTNPNA